MRQRSVPVVRYGAVSILLLVGLLAGCNGSDSQRAERPRAPVQIVPYQVSYEYEQRRIEAVGTARARRSATIFAESGGEVTAVYFRTGERLEEGDLILELEARQERLAVRQAEVAVKDAEQLLARYQRIDVPGAISDSQIDEARTALEAARISLDVARNALAERAVRAPFTGYVGLNNVDAGTRITTAIAITRLDDRSVLYVDFEAPEQVFGRFGVGDAVAMEPFAEPAATYMARVLAVNSSIEPVSRSFTVRAEIDNGDDRLRPGMSFRVAFSLPGQRYPSIPEAAILWGGDGAYVWGIEEGVARRIPITIVDRMEGQVLVKGAIAEGASIVARGVQKVREGSAVAVATQAAALRLEFVPGVGGP
ncbi:MAG: efflux RND transporter periplasmic adaptor subunit [Pseudomonadota bacterium]